MMIGPSERAGEHTTPSGLNRVSGDWGAANFMASRQLRLRFRAFSLRDLTQSGPQAVTVWCTLKIGSGSLYETELGERDERGRTGPE